MRTTLMMCLAAATWTHAAAAQSTGTGANALDSSPDAMEEKTLRLTPSDVRVLVSVQDRHLWVVVGDDTVQSTKVSVASGHELSYAGRTWQFETPRGVLKVLGKRTDPVWNPPDWHYAEVASSHGLKLKRLGGAPTRLRDGSRLVVRDSVVGLVFERDTTFNVLPVDEHIVFDETLFIPPVGTRNRQLLGELGRFALDLGNGYMLHGTRDQRSIGTDTTHGCIRLPDEVLEWMYRNIPVGAKVIVQ